MSRKHDRAAELRAIADGRLMLNVRNGVTVPRSMLAMIADEFEAMSTALAAKDAELAEVRQQYVDANEARIDAEAQLAEVRKALEPFANAADDLDDAHKDSSSIWEAPCAMSIYAGDLRAARRAREAQGGENG